MTGLIIVAALFGQVRVQDEGADKGLANRINCSGAGVTCSVSAGTATITVPGGGVGGVCEDIACPEGQCLVRKICGSAPVCGPCGGGASGITVEDTPGVTAIDCGEGLTCSVAGGTATVTVTGGGGPSGQTVSAYGGTRRHRCEFVRSWRNNTTLSTCPGLSITNLTYDSSGATTNVQDINGRKVEVGYFQTNTTSGNAVNITTSSTNTFAAVADPIFEGWAKLGGGAFSLTNQRWAFGLSRNWSSLCTTWGATNPSGRIAFTLEAGGTLTASATDGVALENTQSVMVSPAPVMTDWNHFRVEVRSSGTLAVFYVNGVQVASLSLSAAGIADQTANAGLSGGSCTKTDESAAKRAWYGPMAMEFMQ